MGFDGVSPYREDGVAINDWNRGSGLNSYPTGANAVVTRWRVSGANAPGKRESFMSQMWTAGGYFSNETNNAQWPVLVHKLHKSKSG
jgi:hypothetical protein